MTRDKDRGLTAERVRHLFKYTKSTGILIRRVDVFGVLGNRVASRGDVVGSVSTSDGYLYCSVDGRRYLVHRLICVWVTGAWPECEVDHRSGVRTDNRWRNLRHASTTQNRRNSLGHCDRVGPYQGVYRHSKSKKPKYVAQITHHKRVIYLGLFDEPEAAYLARCWAEHDLFGKYSGRKSRGAL